MILYIFYICINIYKRRNWKYINDHEQYYNTLFLRKTSNKDLRAKVYGNHPGTLISKFLRAAS